ncbi:MAG TPA: HlyD family efflux transporter periplasmic adaptor subunit [Myxococcota bacterium]|nr:HlyD family efflux transporter periplasmic adaptor subunit [Myxococcota bacterium]
MKRRRLASLACALWLGLSACSGGDGDAVGTLERDRIELIAEASEPIAEIAVREGDPVQPGALLLRLDGSRFAALVSQAEGARDRAAARLAELRRGPRREEIAQGRARLAGAEGALETAKADLARTRQLVTSGVASQARLDQDRARYDEALAQRDAARAELAAMLEGTTAEELAQAEGAVAEAESALADVRLRAGRLEIRAPVAGRIDALPFEVGERPPQGATVVVMLAEGAPYARVFVPEALRVRVVPGVAARVHVDGVDHPFDARVRSVASDASFTPYHALTERDRGRLVFVAEVDLEGDGAQALPTGVPVQVEFLLE